MFAPVQVNIDAWISYFGLNLMMLLSLRPVRRSHYQTFKVCHHIGLAFFIGGLNFHSPFVFPFLMVVILYITSNYIYRWTTTRIRQSSACLQHLEATCCTGLC